MRKRSVWLTLLGVLVLAGFFYGWLGREDVSSRSRTLANAASVKNPAVIARGQYLVVAGDCAGCHTSPGGSPYAGGLPLATPFGDIAAPNLTPDRVTGLGGWQFDDFWRALHNGQGLHGKLLYPVFSYTSYTKVTPEDAEAMFAYLQSLPAVQNTTPAPAMPFPYGIRSALRLWRALYFDAGVYRDDATKSAQWNRGAYLVQGLGHCNECHATRDAFGGVTGEALSGGLMPAQGWYAPDLSMQTHGGLQGWTQQDVVDLLKTGQSSKGVAFGPMAEVIYLSTQHLTDDDLRAIATYLGGLPARLSPAADKSPFDSTALVQQGTAIYEKRCAACHGRNGEGIAGVYPLLDNNASVNEPTGINATRVVLLGGFAPATENNPRPYSMPPFAQQLTDAEVAAVVTFIRQSWSNHASAVKESDVAQWRHTPIN